MPQLSIADTEILEAALIGYQKQQEELERKIADLRRLMRGRAATNSSESNHGKRTMSAAARRRIGLAQKKRWAAYKAGHPKSAAKPRKRVISAAGRARIAAATRKRWAAYRKEHQAR